MARKQHKKRVWTRINAFERIDDRLHIFVDFSNISHIQALQLEDTEDFSLRIDVRKLACVIRGSREGGRQVVVGSQPTPEHSIWKFWSNAGFEVRTLVNNEDEFIVEQAHHCIIHENPGVLALVTGDGHQNGQGASFPNLVLAAIEKQWRVEIWAWRKGLSQTYLQLAKKHPSHLSLQLLDHHRDRVLFKDPHFKLDPLRQPKPSTQAVDEWLPSLADWGVEVKNTFLNDIAPEHKWQCKRRSCSAPPSMIASTVVVWRDSASHQMARARQGLCTNIFFPGEWKDPSGRSVLVSQAGDKFVVAWPHDAKQLTIRCVSGRDATRGWACGNAILDLACSSSDALVWRCEEKGIESIWTRACYSGVCP
jgi:hypothetical protein